LGGARGPSLNEHCRTSATSSLRLGSASLAQAAALAGVDLSEPAEAGHDTPPLGDPSTPRDIDASGAQAAAERFRFE
jgi:hypothetical protein